MLVSSVYAQPPTVLWFDGIPLNDIAISKDGQYVAAVEILAPTAVNFYSQNGDGTPIWTSTLSDQTLSVAISADGDCVVAGTASKIYFWKNARSLSGTPTPAWSSTNLGPIEKRCLDISDDGNYIAAAGTAGPSPLYYWARATTLSGDPTYTWDSAPGVDFNALDMSSDGDSIFAGGSKMQLTKSTFGAGQKANLV